MKSLFALLVLIMCQNAQAAGTAVYTEGNLLRATLNGASDSEDLYKALKIEKVEGRSDSAKIFSTGDQAVEIYCTASSLPFGTPFSCTLSIDLKKKSKTTFRYEDNGFLRASINDMADAGKLFNLLDLKNGNGRSGASKTFQSKDKKAEINCTKSSIPIGLPYGCTVSISTSSK